jgi:hypothetical protein
MPNKILDANSFPRELNSCAAQFSQDQPNLASFKGAKRAQSAIIPHSQIIIFSLIGPFVPKLAIKLAAGEGASAGGVKG